MCERAVGLVLICVSSYVNGETCSDCRKTDTQSDRRTDTQPDRQPHNQTDRQTDTQPDRQTHIQADRRTPDSRKETQVKGRQ